ncbi:hypothetical protein Clacol_003465 [Clathrus columnatus]|uniref:Uncharacterized protein n=1 Tax=Clathrus columnatus TaxID=1419009 RepID=A0AAV5A6Z6_9AGAM|nr:hypothetical protein Clacol_003465 [Clathrus columnatus]
MSGNALPALSSQSNDVTQPESNSNITLDSLGPMVVNTDGTLSRIINWSSMTQSEREHTLKVLSNRNKLRSEKLTSESKMPPTNDVNASGRSLEPAP